MKEYSVHHVEISAAEGPGPAELSKEIAGLEYPAILGANNTAPDGWGLSYWCFEPAEIFEAVTESSNPLQRFSECLAKRRLRKEFTGKQKTHFFGGWVGYLSYDLNRYIEKVEPPAKDDLGLPLVWFGFYDRVICYDHRAGKFILYALCCDGESPEEKFERIRRILHRARETVLEPIPLGGAALPNEFRLNMPRDEYIGSVERIKRHIYDGDVYQINFSQRFQRQFNAPPARLHQWLSEHNPNPYSAYIDGGGFAIASASCELFIETTGKRIHTCPIKGTRPRVLPGVPGAAEKK